MIYDVAERFKSVQGEGSFAGTPMAFIRFVGCSVGKKICNACDTDFEKTHSWRGGGRFDSLELLSWYQPFKHVCLTGGEPLDQDLADLLEEAEPTTVFHIETSGTKLFPGHGDSRFDSMPRSQTWVCVSPKPGFKEGVIADADEVKVIVPGLGAGDGWPTLQDALRWADSGKTVFLQPRNGKDEIDLQNLALCEALVLEHPQLRLSVQLHKLLRVR